MRRWAAEKLLGKKLDHLAKEALRTKEVLLEEADRQDRIAQEAKHLKTLLEQEADFLDRHAAPD